MSKAKFNENHKKIIDAIFEEIPEVKPGKMFGYPGYYIGGKLFACIYMNGVGLKLPEKLANQLRERDYIDYFQPLGRKKMREWIQINRVKSEDYYKDKDVLFSSLSYVASIAGVNISLDSFKTSESDFRIVKP